MEDPSLVDAVEARLREDIVNGALPSGRRLRVEVLRRRYATGATPIREALSRLLTEGLVELSNNRGFSVPPLTFADLLDLSRARALIEGAAVREAAAHGGEEWEVGVVAAFHRLTRRAERDLSDAGNLAAFYDAHHGFHAALLAGCRSPRLLDIQQRLERQHSRYYRQLPFERIAAEDLVGAHRAVVDAVLAQDGGVLAELMGRHVMRTAEVLDLTTFEAAFAREVDIGDRTASRS